MNRLPMWLVLTAILASSSTIDFRKDIYLPQQESVSSPVWTESLTSNRSFDGMLFKTMQDVQHFFSKRNLEPRASIDGELGLMYKLK